MTNTELAILLGIIGLFVLPALFFIYYASIAQSIKDDLNNTKKDDKK
ncbi:MULTISPECIES: hypothetical protein [unclassified Campylobacter]|nr:MULTISPECIES: hypothetical protein [unclassified Campylobacter]NDJ28054.1 hypothetical protein [Campylobacter sp. MIT 19-121]